MDQYKVVTDDGKTIGHVVDSDDLFLIVETGHVLKTRHPVPRMFGHVDDAEHVVTLTLPKDVVAGSPKVGEDGFNREEAAQYYGLPETAVAGP